MLSADVLGAAGGEKIECPSQHHFPCLNTCLNTSFLVSTPVDHHLSPRLNTWLLNAESCLTSEPQALFCAASFTRGGSAAVVRLDTSFAMVGARSGSCTPWRCLGG